MLHWIFSIGDIKSSIHVSLLLSFAIFSFFAIDCAVRERLLELECPCRERLLELECPCLGIWRTVRDWSLWVPQYFRFAGLFFPCELSKVHFVVACWSPRWAVSSEFGLGSLALGNTHWTDEDYGSFQCCSFCCGVDCSGGLCFWSALTILV